MYLVPENLSEEFKSRYSPRNMCVVKDGVRKVCVMVRQYLGTDAAGKEQDEYGGVDLPLIEAVDPASGRVVEMPEHIVSNVYSATSNVYVLKSDENDEMPFFLAPVSKYYPNNSTAYLYARTRLRGDSVLTFSFIPAPIPGDRRNMPMRQPVIGRYVSDRQAIPVLIILYATGMLHGLRVRKPSLW